MHEPHIVVMGGGTGTFPVISAIKHFPVKVSSVITVSDSGGSSGRIRDEFGFQPVGDLRQSLAALAEHEGEVWIRKLLLYRFEKGSGLRGHNLGNLILTALQDMTGDTATALLIAEKIFRLEGEVIPATKTLVNLSITYSDGETVVGEHVLDQDTTETKKITEVSLVPQATIHPLAEAAILDADTIIIGPGDFYGSIAASLLPEGTKVAFANSHAKIVYILNLMTRFTQTHSMTAADHVAGIEKLIGKKVDVIVCNKQPISPDILQLYEQEKEFPVIDDLASDPRVLRADIVKDEVTEKSASDTAHRSLLRHDSVKLRTVLKELVLQDHD